MVEGIRDYAMFLLDSRGRIVSWTGTAQQMFGYTSEEVLGQPVELLYTPQDVQAGLPRRHLQRAAAEGSHAYDGWRIRKDGSRIWADVVTARLEKAPGRPSGFDKVVRDITRDHETQQNLERSHDVLEDSVKQRTQELTATAQRLRESEAQTHAILDTAVDAIITIDARANIQSFNRAAERLFGYSAAEVIGKNVKFLMPEPYSGEHDQYMLNYLRTGRKKIIGIGREVVGLRKDGTLFPLDLAVSEVRLGNRVTFTGIVRDITERKRLEKEILEISEREQRRIGQDLHDGLCQQLTGIAFLIQALEQKLTNAASPDAAALQQVRELLKEGVGQARSLSHGLYPVDPQPDGLMVGLRNLSSNVRELFRVSCAFQCPRPVLVRDNSVATHLYRIAQEAVQNAIRHGKASRIVIRLAGDDQQITLSIADNGVGFGKHGDGKPGMGLRTMSHRAHVIGATLGITPGRKGGTQVICRLPTAEKNLRPPARTGKQR